MFLDGKHLSLRSTTTPASQLGAHKDERCNGQIIGQLAASTLQYPWYHTPNLESWKCQHDTSHIFQIQIIHLKSAQNISSSHNDFIMRP